MKKIVFVAFLLIVLGTLSTQISERIFAQSYIVNAFIVVPSDWRRRIDSSTEQRYKQNFANAIEEAKQFYAKKLNGHTFFYDPNITVIDAPNPIGNVKLGEGIPHALATLGLQPEVRDAPYGRVYVFLLIGSSNRGAGALGREKDVQAGSTGGQVYLNHEQIEDYGSSNNKIKKIAVGGLIHELGHVFGLSYNGWAKAHPCSIISKDQCIKLPGLGTTIAYPPESEYLNSVMGVGLYGIDSPNVGFNNTIYNPEVQKIYKSPFINPNQDPPPPLESAVSTNATIASISPNPVRVGPEHSISGSGFGDRGVLIIKNSSSNLADYRINIWKDSEIRITVLDVPSQGSYTVSIVNPLGQEIASSQVVIQKTISPSLTPQSSPISSPSPTPISVSSFSPNPITVAQEATITGFGFGTIPGEIQFRNPKVAGYPLFEMTLFKKWTNTEIKFDMSSAGFSGKNWYVSVIAASGARIELFQAIEIVKASLPTPTSTPMPSTSTPTTNPTTNQSPSISPSPTLVPTSTPVVQTPTPSSSSTSVQKQACLNPPRNINIFNDICASPRKEDPKLGYAICNGKYPDCTPFQLVKRADGSLYCFDPSSGFIRDYATCPNDKNTSSPTPTPSGTASPSPSPTPTTSANPSSTILASPTVQSSAPLAPKKKKIVEMSINIVEAGLVMEVSPLTFNNPPSIRLPIEKGLSAYHVIILLKFDDDTSKSIPFTFRYKAAGSTNQIAPTPTPSIPTPVPATSGNCSGVCSGGRCMVDDLIDPNGICPSEQPTPTPASVSVPTPVPNSSILKSEGLGSCYTNPSYDSNICPSIFRPDKGGAGGQCGPENAGKSVDVPCQITCPNGNVAYGNTTSTCRTDGCYYNDSCYCDAVCASTGDQF